MEKLESKFMSDHSEGDYGIETLLDYELSWVLRMAADKEYMKTKPRLYHQCRHILFKLLGIDDNAGITVKCVKTWKQWRYVDLVADIYLVRDNNEELHVLMTENKAYTKMSQKQRDDYPKTIKRAYNNSSIYGSYILHQVLVTCFDPQHPVYEEQKVFIKGSDWDIISVEELPDWNASEQTESDLFNEFWLNNWNTLTE